MASLSDLLTSSQAITQAITALGQTFLSVQGKINYPDITAATLVKSEPGRVCQIAVTATGGAVGAVYDSTNTATPSRKLYTIPATVGSFTVNMPSSYGIVVVPGAGQTVTISYS